MPNLLTQPQLTAAAATGVAEINSAIRHGQCGRGRADNRIGGGSTRRGICGALHYLVPAPRWPGSPGHRFYGGVSITDEYPWS
jgi:hypothetical protein